MQSLTTRSYFIDIAGKLQAKETVFLLSASVLVSLLVHLFPAINNQPAGAYLLPIFYAPLIAVLFFRFHTAFITALFSPAINYFITGKPQFQLVEVMTLQLMMFVVIVYFICRIEKLRSTSALAGYILTMAALFPVLSMLSFLLPGKNASVFIIDSVLTGIPGIVIIAAVNYAAVKLFKKNS